MSGDKTRSTPETALEDALRRIRVLERIPEATPEPDVDEYMEWYERGNGFFTSVASGDNKLDLDLPGQGFSRSHFEPGTYSLPDEFSIQIDRTGTYHVFGLMGWRTDLDPVAIQIKVQPFANYLMLAGPAADAGGAGSDDGPELAAYWLVPGGGANRITLTSQIVVKVTDTPLQVQLWTHNPGSTISPAVFDRRQVLTVFRNIEDF